MPVSAERVMVAWLKTVPEIDAAGGRVATRLPREPVFPFVVVQEIGGGDSDVLPVYKPYVQVDVYADPGDRGVADDLALAIVNACQYQRNTTIPAESATVLKGELVAKRAVSEPGTGWERFALDIILTVREDI